MTIRKLTPKEKKSLPEFEAVIQKGEKFMLFTKSQVKQLKEDLKGF